jgi:large subunit ribosomal protein L17
MRHRVGHRKLGRVTEHRIAMLRNQALDLLRHERIETTVPKAKELRPFVERLITVAKRRVGDGDSSHGLFARRLVLRDLHDAEVVKKLFETLAPRYASRPGGYTRILRLGHRRGDNAEVAQIELVGSEYDPKASGDKESPTEAAKPKTVGSRLRAAAARLRGNKAADAEADTGKTDKKRAEKSRPRSSPHKKPG